jgi:hypothetical protein
MIGSMSAHGPLKSTTLNGNSLVSPVSRSLTPRQRAFVTLLVNLGCDGAEAARQAGYGAPKQRAYALLRQPAVLAAIRVEHARVIGSELASKAIRAIGRVLDDAGARHADQLTAARLALEAARIVGRQSSAWDDVVRAGSSKPLHEMSVEELDRYIDDARVVVARLSARHKSDTAEA